MHVTNSSIDFSGGLVQTTIPDTGSVQRVFEEAQHNMSCQWVVGDLPPTCAVSPAEIAEKLQKARGKEGQPQSHL